MRRLDTCASRLPVEIADTSRVQDAALTALGVVACPSKGALHIIIGPRVSSVAAGMTLAGAQSA